jgi:hypothetical protein
MRVAVALLAIGTVALCAGSCVFDLADVVQPAGGAGGGGEGGAAGMGGTAGTGGAAGPEYEVLVSYDATGRADVADFVALVALDDTRIDYAHANVDGSDVHFVADDDTPLAHEIESWDPTGRSMVWVRLPALLSTGGSFRLRYGGEAVAAEPDAVWAGYVGVYHLAGDAADSSAEGHDGTATATEPAAGQIGDGLAFDGTASQVDLGSVFAFDVEPNQQRTFSAWIARGITTAAAMSIGRSKSSCCMGWQLLVLDDIYANLRADATIGNCCTGGTTGSNAGTPALPNMAADVDWHLVVTVMDRATGDHYLYLDGVERGHSTMLPLTGAMMSGDAALGVDEYDEARFHGTIDEARIDARAASADEIAMRWESERDLLLSYGPEMER